jgi:hypoxia induced protein
MRARDSFEMNRMFRARIYAQFFTLLAVVAGGIYYKNERKQRKEFGRMLEERKAQEKRDAWLRELEVREKEDKGWKERHAAIGDASRDAGKKNIPPPASGFDTNKSVQEVADKRRGVGVLDAVKALVYRRGK